MLYSIFMCISCEIHIMNECRKSYFKNLLYPSHDIISKLHWLDYELCFVNTVKIYKYEIKSELYCCRLHSRIDALIFFKSSASPPSQDDDEGHDGSQDDDEIMSRQPSDYSRKCVASDSNELGSKRKRRRRA
ncbi:hypothetical protein L6452_10184 [Arctium lappa]|uniref:Uncharacterized protein n=1 Tax=Arctium lappa TaxID=4217 RepID=A0ACB9DM57_ARCLA|nr:hypothetical protein L6452_10184 [Arctium lappa]